MEISNRGLDLIKSFEGLSLRSYADPGTGGDPWTVGYGHCGPDVRCGMTVTADRASELLREDVAHAQAAVESLVKVSLTTGQNDALVSFEYNTGKLKGSTLLAYVNQRKFRAAADQFLLWDHAGGRVLPGLTLRRTKERLIFLSPDLSD